MKKIIMLIIAAFILCSCQSESVGVTYDCDNNFQQNIALKVCADDDTLFFEPDISTNLWYYDKSSGISGILCGKPECPHTGTDCNSYFNVSDLSLYGGRLYGVSVTSFPDCCIISANPDGSGRRTELDLSNSEFKDMLGDSVSNLRGMFHRGYFYACGTHNTVKDGIIGERVQVFAYPLDGSGGGTIYESSENTSVKIIPYGDFLYIVAYSKNGVEICSYSPEDGIAETLYSSELQISSPKLWVDGSGIYLGDGSEKAMVYKLDFSSKTLSEYMDFNSGSDEEYYLYGFSDDFVIGGNMDGIKCLLCLKSYSGETVLETSFTPPGVLHSELLTTFPCGCDGKYIYLFSKVWSAEHDVQFLSKVSVKSGKSEVIWTNDVGGERR